MDEDDDPIVSYSTTDIIAQRVDSVANLLKQMAALPYNQKFQAEALELARAVRLSLPLPARGELKSIVGGKASVAT